MAPKAPPKRMTIHQGFDYLTEQYFLPEEGLSEGGEAFSFDLFKRYQRRPVSFCKEILRERLTPDVRRMMLSVRDNTVTLARSANGTGKTHGAARVAIWFLKCFPGAKVFTAAAPPENNLKTLLWGEIGSVVHTHPEVFSGDKVSISSMKIETNPIHFLQGLTIPASGTPQEREARFSGKHAPYMLFIIDEGDAVPREVYRAIESCMSGGIMVRLLVLFNPRNQSGPTYLMERNEEGEVVELTAFSHPNVIKGKPLFPGAVDRETTVRRINLWTVPLGPGEKPDRNCFEVPKFLVGYVAKKAKKNEYYPALKGGWRRIIEPAFAYMVLGKYPAMAQGQLISMEWVMRAVDRWNQYARENGANPPSYILPVMGQDVGELGDDESVAILRFGNWVQMPEAWGGVDPTVTAEKAARIYKRNQVIWCNVDGTGVGASVAPAMKKLGCPNSHRIMVSSSPTEECELGRFGLIRDQGWWAMREWIREDPSCMLPPDEDLIEELTTPLYWKDAKGNIKVSDRDYFLEKLGRSNDKSSALMLTFCPQPAGAVGAGGSFRYA